MKIKKLTKEIEIRYLKKTLSEDYYGILIINIIIAFIGFFSILYEGINDYKRLFIYSTCIVVYSFAYMLFKKEKFTLIISIILLLFYLLHTGLEFYLGYYPNEIIDKIGFTKNQILTVGGVLIDFIPVIYILFRFVLSSVFIRFIVLLLKVKKLEKMKS